MSFPGSDNFHLQKSGLLEVKYYGDVFTLCRVAEWAYMAVVVIEDTTEDEYEESRLTLAAWHINYEFGKAIMENNAVFAATMLSKSTTRNADLFVTIRSSEHNTLMDIRNEIRSGLRMPISDPGLDRLFMEHETRQLKTFLDKYGENPQFSPKKVWPGILMLLVYPFGLPFFYFNKPLWGGIMLAALIVSIIFPVLVIPAGLLGCVFIVMTLLLVFGDRARDRNGLLICSRRRQNLILNSVAKYKRNLTELEAQNG